MSAQSDSLDLKYCIGCGETKLVSEFHRRLDGYQSRCKPCFIAQVRMIQQKDPGKYMIVAARTRAKKAGVLCTLKPGDISIPEKCPVCHVLMEFGAYADRETSPSLDRIVPGSDYTAENCIVICWRCNRLKNNATPEELYAIADYVYRIRKVRGLCG